MKKIELVVQSQIERKSGLEIGQLRKISVNSVVTNTWVHVEAQNIILNKSLLKPNMAQAWCYRSVASRGSDYCSSIKSFNIHGSK
jgi:hypothetical protein